MYVVARRSSQRALMKNICTLISYTFLSCKRALQSWYSLFLVTFTLCSRPGSVCIIHRPASVLLTLKLIVAKSGLLAVTAQHDPQHSTSRFSKRLLFTLGFFLLQSPFYSPVIPYFHAQPPLWHISWPRLNQGTRSGPVLSAVPLCIADPPEKPLMIF